MAGNKIKYKTLMSIIAKEVQKKAIINASILFSCIESLCANDGGEKKWKNCNVTTSINTMTMKGMIPYGLAHAASEVMSKNISNEFSDMELL